MVQSLLLIVFAFILGFAIAYFLFNKSKTTTDSTSLKQLSELTQQLENSKNETTRNETVLVQTQFELKELKTNLEAVNNKHLALTAQNAIIDTEKANLNLLNEDLVTENILQKENLIATNKRAEELNLSLEKVKLEIENFSTKNKEILSDLTTVKQEKQALLSDKLELERSAGELSTKNNILQEQLQEQKQEFLAIQEKAKLEIKQMVQNLLEEKTKSFDQNSKQLMESVLSPLKENLIAFKETVDTTHLNESKERTIIQERIRDLVEKTNEVSKQADNLATALKGQTKTQGDWGEMILESILQKSGLVKDREYTIQENIKSEEGKNQRPDVMIKLPDNRVIIVDSKVSLNAYERFTSAETPEKQQAELKNHVLAIKTHINQLSAKKYDDLTDSLDFTMMFMPIEPAYMVAMQAESDLWNFAYEKRILLVSPTNFMASVKLFADLWKREYQNQNALDIAMKAGALYDKFVGFVEDLDKVSTHLDKASTAHNDALKKLATGNGNLVKRVETLKELGVKANKSLPTKYIELPNM